MGVSSRIPRSLSKYIKENMPKSICEASCCVQELPCPYTVPCPEGGFRNFFYWDTYFTNWGLYALDMTEQAGNNLRNMAALIGKFGYMPNADVLTDRSQPPLFIRGLAEYYDKTGDLEFLAEAFPAAKSEYKFWMTKRRAECGLNRYGGEARGEALREFNDMVAARLKEARLPDPESRENIHRLACAESGWDFTSRFFRGISDCFAADVCPVELNAILYGAERDLAAFASLLGEAREGERYKQNAEERLALMKRYCYDEQSGSWFDYDERRDERLMKRSAAGFFPAAFGLEGRAKGMEELLDALETEHGLLTCEKSENSERFQWDWPMMWPPLAGICVQALFAAGLKARALSLAEKYCRTVERVFAETGQLWEKYDVVNCGIGRSSEYATPPMLGWTAGVYLRLAEYFEK